MKGLESDLRQAFRTRWRLSPQETTVLVELFRRPGRMVTHERLQYALYPNPVDAPERGAKLSVLVNGLRMWLGRDAVICLPKEGYALTAIGVAACNTALKEAA